MASESVFDVSGYIEPQAATREVIVPSGVNLSAQQFAVCLIGTANRSKRVTDEAVVRALVSNESLTVSGSAPYQATLANRALRNSTNLTVRRTISGQAQTLPATAVSFVAASITGSAAGPFNIAASNAISLEMDGIRAVTMVFTSGGSDAVTISGRQINVQRTVGNLTVAAATRAQIASAINFGLAAATALGFGSAYSAVAADATTGVSITSPVTNSSSDVRVFAAIANSATSTIFGSASLDAGSIIQINAAYYNASATWTASYVQLVDDLDSPANTPTSILRVGSFPGTSDFVSATDWQTTSGQVDWSLDSAALLQGTVASTFDVSTNDSFTLNVDGIADILVDLNALASPPLGYANPATPATATAAEVVANINAVACQQYGPRYRAIASVYNTSYVQIQSITEGKASSVVLTTTAAGATVALQTATITAVFGSLTLPYERDGAGRRPAVGSTYYVTYDYTRPTSDYSKLYQHFSIDQVEFQHGLPSFNVQGYNPLAIAGRIAFQAGAPYIYTVQINDSSTPGNPTTQQIQDAIDAAGFSEGPTEIIVVGEPGTRGNTHAALIAHLEAQNAPLTKHPRRIGVGMAAGTAIGDTETAGSFVYLMGRTMQVDPNSPGRGRMFVGVPPQQAGVTRDVQLDDGSTATLTLDSTYIAVAGLAQRTGFINSYETLTRKSVNAGFNTADITSAWKPEERKLILKQGALLLAYESGLFKWPDANSTELGAGGLEQFAQDSATYQKDVVVRKVNRALDANIVGIVPFDLANFILDVRILIASVIEGEINSTIAPFTDETTGAARAIDLNKDILVKQSSTDRRKFHFGYWFNLRYPALRLLGQYSVDAPFFSAV